jgi:membrane protein implicated in regulation of membrane protease activity
MIEEFRTWICRRKMLWTILLALTLIHLVLALLAIGGIEKGSASYYILWVDFAFIAFLLVILALVFWRCGYLHGREPDY